MFASETEVRECFTRMNVQLATFDKWIGVWSANSQYGYTLERFPDRETAELFTISYYVTKPHLIRQ